MLQRFISYGRQKMFCALAILAYVPYLQIKVGLCDHYAICASLVSQAMNFQTAETIFMNLGIIIMAPEPL
jgi:hypothetical protein